MQNPYIGPLPGPKFIMNDKPDISDPLNQTALFAMKWYEAQQFGFVLKYTEGNLFPGRVDDIEKAWMAKLPAFVGRERKRRKWAWIPLVGRIAKRQSLRDIDATFKTDLK